MVIIKGLSADGYLINNPIVITAEVPMMSRVDVIFANLTTGQNSGILTYFASPTNGEAKIDISKPIKALMEAPNEEAILTDSVIVNTTAKFQIAMQSYDADGDTDDVTITKTFVRGGKIGNGKNLTAVANQSTRITPVIPYFNGYPIYEYFMQSNFKVQKTILTEFNFDNLELINRDTCNGIYIKFLNQNGGYSFWLFDDQVNNIASSPLGYTNNISNVTDFGLEVESKFSLTTKISAKYIDFLIHLSVSPDVSYFAEDRSWKKIRCLGGTIPKDSGKKVYKVTMSFEQFTNFEPSLL